MLQQRGKGEGRAPKGGADRKADVPVRRRTRGNYSAGSKTVP